MGNVVITGGKSGLGLELAKAFEAAGNRVIVGCRHAQAAPVGEAYELLLTRELAANLRQAGDAKVVNISSQVGSMMIGQRIGRDVCYAASTAALNMVSIKLGQALKPDGVTVVAMHTGPSPGHHRAIAGTRCAQGAAASS